MIFIVLQCLYYTRRLFDHIKSTKNAAIKAYNTII